MPALPAIQFPFIGNSGIIGLFSLLHIALAGLSIGFMVLAPIFEWHGRTNPFAFDLARTLTRFTVVVFSTSTVLAVIMVELMIGLFPLTTMWLWNQFRGPIGLGLAAFLLQLLALYPYYHYWDHFILNRPSLHLSLGIAAALLMLVWVLVLDGMGSYMLTPRQGHGTWGNMMNATWLPLALHRLIGDVLLGGYVMAAYGVWRLNRPADRIHQGYYLYLAQTGWLIGVAGLLLQPFSGLLYAWSIQSSVPEAYEHLIHGPFQFLVFLQFLLIALSFIANYFVAHTALSAHTRVIDYLFVLSAIGLVASIDHAPLRRVFLYLLVCMMIWSLTRLWLSGNIGALATDSRSRPLMIGLGVLMMLTYLTMGTIRETARRPDTVRNTISLEDEERYPGKRVDEQSPKTLDLTDRKE